MAPGSPCHLTKYYGLSFLVDIVNNMLNEGWELQGGVSGEGPVIKQAMIKKH